MEYVIETRNGVQYRFEWNEVEQFHYAEAVGPAICVECYDPDSSVSFATDDVVRWFVRRTS